MDSGLLELTEPATEQYDVLKKLLPEEVLGVIDQMLCHEVQDHNSNVGLERLMVSRLLGIWDIPYRRLCSRQCISTDCYGQR